MEIFLFFLSEKVYRAGYLFHIFYISNIIRKYKYTFVNVFFILLNEEWKLVIYTLVSCRL